MHSRSRPNHRARQQTVTTLAVLLLGLILTSCAWGDHRVPGEGPPRTPRHLRLDRPVSVATLHFPAGTYLLQSEDAAGYYYAAPRPIAQHTALGSVFRKGGIYVDKRDPRKLRGYVYWIGGALTHIGNFSKKKHEFF